MNWVDWALIALVAACTLHGLNAGTFSQTIGLTRVLLAFLVATAIHVLWLPPAIVERGEALLPSGTLYAVSLLVLYVLAWLALFFVFFFLRLLFPPRADMDMGQRLGGAFLGLVRGFVFVFLIIILVDYRSFGEGTTWIDSRVQQYLSPYAQDFRRGIMQADDFTREHLEKFMYPVINQQVAPATPKDASQ